MMLLKLDHVEFSETCKYLQQLANECHSRSLSESDAAKAKILCDECDEIETLLERLINGVQPGKEEGPKAPAKAKKA